MKLKNAAQTTAYCGRSTRVDTTVAIELAASWRPFRKSNSKATPISATSNGKARDASIGSGVVDHDALDLVGDILEAVQHSLQVHIDLAADEVVHRLRFTI